MIRHRYSVQSFNTKTNVWKEIYSPNSQKQARKDARDWEAAVKDWRARGRTHLSGGVRIVINGDQGEPILVRMWGTS